jgi:hypothetical protein
MIYAQTFAYCMTVKMHIYWSIKPVGVLGINPILVKEIHLSYIKILSNHF